MNGLPSSVPRFKPRANETKDDFINIHSAANFIGRTVASVYKWYDWYYDDRYEKPVDMPTIPLIIQEAEKRPIMIRKYDLTNLIKFRDYIKRKRPMGDYNRQFLSFEKRKDLHPSKLARIKPPKSIPASIYFKDLIDLADNDLEHARELMKYAVERKKQLDAEKEAKENEKNS